MIYRFHIFANGRDYYGKEIRRTQDTLDETHKFIREVLKDKVWMNLEDKDGNIIYFPAETLKNSVITLEKMG